ncbi:uncharacterized protein LOC134659886 [Cydia amplana]|uniref:uncharacterized protein LOC134659886 n=1 Tax=Cydia amplana TaxID=1869771 RepID=UPI002FE58C13
MAMCTTVASPDGYGQHLCIHHKHDEFNELVKDPKQSEPSHSDHSDDGHNTDELLRMLGEDDSKKKKVLTTIREKNARRAARSSEDDYFLEGAKVTKLKVAKNAIIRTQPMKAEPEDFSDRDSDMSDDEESTVKRMFTTKPRPNVGRALKSSSFNKVKTEKPTPTPVKQYTNTSKRKSLLKPRAEHPEIIDEEEFLEDDDFDLDEVSDPVVSDRPTHSENESLLKPRAEHPEIIDEEEFLEDDDFDLDELKSLLKPRAEHPEIIDEEFLEDNNFDLDEVSDATVSDRPAEHPEIIDEEEFLDRRTTTLTLTSKNESLLKPRAEHPEIIDEEEFLEDDDFDLDENESLLKPRAEHPEIIDEEEFLEDDDFDLDEDVGGEWRREDEDVTTQTTTKSQPIRRPERMDEEIPSDDDSHSEDDSLYDVMPSSDSEDMDDWFTLDIRAERAGDYLPWLGDKAHKLLTEEKHRVSSRLAALRQSVTALQSSGRVQSDQIKVATEALHELDAMLAAA